MTNNRKILIQSLAMVIFAIILYRNWEAYDVKVFYLELLCIVEIIIQFLYIFFNRKKLSKDERDRELIIVIIYLIVMVGAYLIKLLVV